MSTLSKKHPSKRTVWAGRILTGLVMLAFIMSGTMKLMLNPVVIQTFGKAGIPQAAILPLGILELSCLALYVIPRTVVLGTLLLTGYLGGAIVTSIILRTSLTLPVLLGLVVWAGALLRVPELRTLIPIRRKLHSPTADKSLGATPAARENEFA